MRRFSFCVRNGELTLALLVALLCTEIQGILTIVRTEPEPFGPGALDEIFACVPELLSVPAKLNLPTTQTICKRKRVSSIHVKTRALTSLRSFIPPSSTWGPL